MLGARIAALRRMNGWSQAELAQLLQVSPSAVGMYEQGRREPAAEILVALAQLFGVSVDYLLTGKTPQDQQDQTQQSLEALLESAQAQLANRKNRPLSRQELAVLFAALLMES